MFKKGDLLVRLNTDPVFPELTKGMLGFYWDDYDKSVKDAFKCRYLNWTYTYDSYHGEFFDNFRLATKLERAMYEQRKA